ncbi:MAG: hypothetical protein LBL59_08460 [Xanthomonadaceae bacterium]|jgi:hypothetical protein|nr:hypothetical protein [Xanthomonadaceae bacterium]
MHLVYLSPVPWASFAQRPHKFVEWFHFRSGSDVTWVDPYPTRLPALADLRRGRGGTGADAGIVPGWMTLLSPRALPLEPVPGSGTVNRLLLWSQVLRAVRKAVGQGESRIGIGKPSKLALRILAENPDTPSFYDVMDDFPAFYSGWSRFAMDRHETRLLERVDRILVSSSKLQSRLRRYGDKMTVALNACAVDALPPVDTLSPATDRTIIGYVGTIGHWFDWDLVIAIAEQNPSAIVRLVGPVYVPSTRPLPDNVELIPPCSHRAAIRAMQDFSIGMIPFKCNDLTASVDPIKYYEYRALGLPVVSTGFGEMTQHAASDGVWLMHADADLAKQVRDALGYRFDPVQIREFRAANSWGARFDASGIL